MSDDGTTPRPIESPAVPADEVEIDAVEPVDEEYPAPAAPQATDWEADPLDAADQRREVPLDDDR